MDELTQLLGVLGAYFAVLLVLSVSVETLLEPITWFKGLSRKISPDEAMKDVREWLPKDPATAATASANAIANLTQEYKVVLDDVNNRVEQIKSIAGETAQGLGITKPVQELETKLAVYMTELRAKYDVTERTRVTILRILSAVIGIAIAVFLQINTFDMLGGLFPADVQQALSLPVAQVGGMVLTGLAASAGSGFWHDQLGKLRALKNTAGQIQSASK